MESRDMASPGVEYLGVMAWAAQFQWIPDKIGPGELAEVRLGGNKCRVGEKVEFVIDVPDKGEVGLDKLEAEVTGPGGPVGNMEFDPRDGKGSFTPREYGNLIPPDPPANQPTLHDEDEDYHSISGMHEVLVTNEGEAVRGCPNYVRSMPNSKKDYEGIEPCAVGSTVEVMFLSPI